jgi:ATP-dependent DNA helicase DinG
VIESLVKPRGAIPLAVQRLTGLSDDDVAAAPRVEAIAAPLAVALAGRAIVAHNAAFERSFLTRYVAVELDSARYLDTQDLLAVTHPDASDLRLETFARELLGRDEKHRALADAQDTLAVISELARRAQRGLRRGAVARAALASFVPDSPWIALFPDAFSPGGAAASSMAPVSQYVQIPKSSEAPVPFDADAIAAGLADEERGRRHFPGYRAREQQIRLARKLVLTLDSGGRLLLEGGTGVGKSLAYLAALIPFAMERAAGSIREPLIVSTRTKLLQDQLLTKDIPAAAAMLGYPELRALSIKGRANYACAWRLEQVLSEGREPSIFPEDRAAYAALAACARTRPHGEIAGVPAAMLMRYPALRDLLRRSVAARAEQCSREQCAQEKSCAFGQRRAALVNAHLVVANHDLLLRWPPDYPNFTHVVIDEAHELAGVVDEVFAVEVRPEEIFERFDELFGRPAAAGRGAPLRGLVRVRDLERDSRAWRRELHQDLSALGRVLAAGASEFGERELPADAEDLLPEAAALAVTSAERLDTIADLVSAQDASEDEDRAEAIAKSVAALRDAALGLRSAFRPPSQGPECVAGFERLELPYDRWRLAIRAISPAPAFEERFASRLETLTCVSASLFVADDPFAALGELELDEHSPVPVQRMRVDSPFPYEKHMRIAALEPEGDLVDETAAILALLARHLGGRTLGLFTSLRRMNQAAELLARDLREDGIEVLTPRRASDDPVALVERFARTGGGSVLLGARTFWQGLDIAGDALQAVVIEKLPFEVPTELRKRRAARIAAAGQNDFERYTLGKMLLHLKQMSGRLIRSEDDRGLVVIVEGRTKKNYFWKLSSALPPGCRVQRATPADLIGLLAEVGVARS